MRKHESYTTYYPQSWFSIYLSKGAWLIALDILGAGFMVLFILGFFSFLSILQAGV